MKRGILKFTSLFLAVSLMMMSCASNTLIESIPSGAKLYMNGEFVGTTPHSHTDTKIVGSSTTVRIEKEGYETFSTILSRNEDADAGAIVGGIFFLFPFLWTMKYKPVHTYTLKEANIDNAVKVNAVRNDLQDNSSNQSKAQKLRDLKQLLDDNIITQLEFEKEKSKILEQGG